MFSDPFSFLLLISALGILVPDLDPLFSVISGCDHSYAVMTASSSKVNL